MSTEMQVSARAYVVLRRIFQSHVSPGQDNVNLTSVGSSNIISLRKVKEGVFPGGRVLPAMALTICRLGPTPNSNWFSAVEQATVGIDGTVSVSLDGYVAASSGRNPEPPLNLMLRTLREELRNGKLRN